MRRSGIVWARMHDFVKIGAPTRVDRFLGVKHQFGTFKIPGANREVPTRKGFEAMTEFVRAELAKLKPLLPTKFSLPLSPRVELTSIVPEDVKIFTSKKKPLRITFVNADPHASKYRALFKCGDDLRQDLLSLQVLGV